VEKKSGCICSKGIIFLVNMACKTTSFFKFEFKKMIKDVQEFFGECE
jgi:hypothetical protein